MKLQNFIKDRHGMIFQGVIFIAFFFLSAITWLAGVVIIGKVFVGFQPLLAICDPRAMILAQNALNAYGVSIVITDICLICWYLVSAGKVESVEGPSYAAY